MDEPKVIARRSTTGRPPAKHSSPDYVQMTVYVKKTVRTDTRIRLFREGRELSALIERLLTAWLEEQPEYPTELVPDWAVLQANRS